MYRKMSYKFSARSDIFSLISLRFNGLLRQQNRTWHESEDHERPVP